MFTGFEYHPLIRYFILTSKSTVLMITRDLWVVKLVVMISVH